MTKAYLVRSAFFAIPLLLGASLAQAEGGTITFRGAIVEDTCSVNPTSKTAQPFSGCSTSVARTASVRIDAVPARVQVTPDTSTDAHDTQPAPRLAIVTTQYL